MPVMLQRTWFCCRRKPTSSALCSVRNAVLLLFAITVFWIFLAAHIGVNRTRTSQKAGSILGAETSKANPSTTVVLNASLVTSTTAVPSTSNLTKRRRYLSQRAPMGGIGQGNLMFMYASLVGIAERNQMTPVYAEDESLRKIFRISAATSLLPIDSSPVTESRACAYDAQFESLSKRQDNVTAVGYLQSWRYFGAISERIRREFTFVERLKSDADEFLRNISTPTTKTGVYIGAHVRRRDMLATFNVDRGYTVATKEYLVGAVRHFRSQFPSEFLVFVVCSDDIDWAKRNFPPPPADNSSVVAFSEKRDAAQDMALLAACNHSIITVGTYGWWSAYLAGGRTVYYQNFPKPGTNLASIFDKNDYYPPEWIGMLL